MLNRPKVDVLIDMQFGSTGKGLLAGFLAESGAYDTVVAANMPNAGHTTVLADGRKWVNKAMPNGVIGSIKNIMMGPGSVFNPAQLRKEIDHLHELDLLEGVNLWIHEAAGVLKPEHAEAEKASLSRISSTMQGSAEALISKIRRQSGAIVGQNMGLMEEHDLAANVIDQANWLQLLQNSKRILVEGSQGYSLGISSGFYPYCTSRECTAGRVLADCGVPVRWLNHVYGVARLHPIRVGNTADGYSGDIYPDQKELSWEALGQEPEYTTVTKRVRRVFSFSMQQFREAAVANGVDSVFLNFANYDRALAQKVIAQINSDRELPPVLLVGVGPKNDDILSIDGFLQQELSV